MNLTISHYSFKWNVLRKKNTFIFKYNISYEYIYSNLKTHYIIIDSLTIITVYPLKMLNNIDYRINIMKDTFFV